METRILFEKNKKDTVNYIGIIKKYLKENKKMKNKARKNDPTE